MKLAWFSNLSDHSSLARWFTTSIIQTIAGSCDVDIFSDDLTGEEKFGLKNFHYLSAAKLHASDPYDYFIYVIDSSRSSNFVRFHAGSQPGVVICCDSIFFNSNSEAIRANRWDCVIKQFHNFLITKPLTLEKLIYDQDEMQVPDFGEILAREAGVAFAFLCNSQWSVNELRSKVEIPNISPLTQKFYYLASPLPITTEIQKNINSFFEYKSKYKVRTKLAFCGAPTLESRIGHILAAIAPLDVTLYWLIDEDELILAKKYLGDFNCSNVKIITGRTPERWLEILDRTAISFHTLFSVHGSLEPWVSLSQAVGNIVISNDYAHCSYLPDEFVFKAETGDREANFYRSFLVALLNQEEGFFNKYSELSRNYAAENFLATDVAKELCIFLETHRQLYSQFLRQWSEFKDLIREQVFYHSKNSDVSLWSSFNTFV